MSIWKYFQKKVISTEIELHFTVTSSLLSCFFEILLESVVPTLAQFRMVIVLYSNPVRKEQEETGRHSRTVTRDAAMSAVYSSLFGNLCLSHFVWEFWCASCFDTGSASDCPLQTKARQLHVEWKFLKFRYFRRRRTSTLVLIFSI